MLNQTKRKHSQSGFTLIEVVVTILLIGATLVLYNATSKIVVINKVNKYKEVALRIADEKVQTLRVAGYSAVPASGSFSDSLISSLPGGAGTLTVSDVNAGTKSVLVTVSWTNPQNGSTQQVRLTTYIAEGGIGQ